MKHRAHQLPDITFGKSVVAQAAAGLLDQELEEIDQALRRRRKELGIQQLWFTREENFRLLWCAYGFGLVCGIAAGLITGFGYAGGFGL